jgi:beta-glucosidase/6-phospho-beta-glucosidase/beta-galactosidase
MRLATWPATTTGAKDDVAIMAELGANAYRFSIAWGAFSRRAPGGQ